jgi:hypothetical protein
MKNSIVSRRQFVRTSAAAAGSVAFASLVPAAVFGANDRIRIGVIGCGTRKMKEWLPPKQTEGPAMRTYRSHWPFFLTSILLLAFTHDIWSADKPVDRGRGASGLDSAFRWAEPGRLDDERGQAQPDAGAGGLYQSARMR